MQFYICTILIQAERHPTVVESINEFTPLYQDQMSSKISKPSNSTIIIESRK